MSESIDKLQERNVSGFRMCTKTIRTTHQSVNRHLQTNILANEDLEYAWIGTYTSLVETRASDVVAR